MSLMHMALIEAVPTRGNMRSVGHAARRLLLFERAKDAVGGARILGESIGLSRRSVNHRLVNDRELHDFELKLTADELRRRAAQLIALADDIEGVIA